MVRLRENESPTQEPVEAPIRTGSEMDNYMFMLREQLVDYLPPHDKKQDEFIQKLPTLIYLPANATDEAMEIYEELCDNRVRLIKLQKVRTKINDWLWSYYNQQLPDIPLQQCREQVKKLFAGKQRFYVICKQVEELLFKLHAMGQ